jgi:FKBP-type peptidyl-prolyl cis-trans isomerase
MELGFFLFRYGPSGVTIFCWICPDNRFNTLEITMMHQNNGLKCLTLFLGFLLSTFQFSGAMADQNQAAGEQFLASNAKKPGVVTTPSGLQYQVIAEGTGAKPSASDEVTVNYRGALISGNEFDSGKGVSFPLNRVIAGWTEGVQLMKVGAKYRFFIPPELAYGERGAGGLIPPNTTLVFDVELVNIK